MSTYFVEPEEHRQGRTLLDTMEESFNEWLANQLNEVVDNLGITTMREIFDAMDDQDKYRKIDNK